MKETSFIEQNKRKWARFEKLRANNSNDPDEVSQLFVEITEDLSYARTFYPRRSVRVYLNQLSQGVFTSLYRHRRQPLGSFTKYWTRTVPIEMYRARYILLTAFLFFALAAGIGIISQQYDNEFVRVILGDGYVEETEQRIANGNPMGVYGEMGQGEMFWLITINNIKVAFFVFAGGITFTVLSYFLLLYNGVMLGSFQWWFKLKGLMMTSFLTIWIHGAFEISSIVIAGAAGITVGNGLLFPKSYSRLQSLVFSAGRGLNIMLSLIPFFIVAGFLESYVTRHYQTIPDVVKAMIIFLSFAIIVLYYVVYPFIVAKKYPELIEVKEVPRYVPKRSIDWTKIRNVGEIFTDTFYLFLQNAGKISRLFFNSSFLIIAALISTIYLIEGFRFNFSSMSWHMHIGTLFGTGSDLIWYKFFGWPLALTLLIGVVNFAVHSRDSEASLSQFFKYMLKPFIWLYMFALMTFAILIFSNGLMLFLLAFVLPFLAMIPIIILKEKTNFFNAFSKCFTIGRAAYAESIGSILVFFLITIIFFFLLNNPMDTSILALLQEIVKQFTITTVDNYAIILNLVATITYVLFIFFMLSIVFVALQLLYHVGNEKQTAQGLYERMQHFGKRSKTVETNIDFE